MERMPGERVFQSNFSVISSYPRVLAEFVKKHTECIYVRILFLTSESCLAMLIPSPSHRRFPTIRAGEAGAEAVLPLLEPPNN